MHFRVLSLARRLVLHQLTPGPSLGMKKRTLFDAVMDYLMYDLLTDCAVIVIAFRPFAGRPLLNSSRSPGTQPVDDTHHRGLKQTASWLAQAHRVGNGTSVPSRRNLRYL